MQNDRTVLQAKRLGIFSVPSSTLMWDACVKMVEQDISALVIVDDQGHLAGILTRTDLLRAELENDQWEEIPVSRYMTSHVVTVAPESTLAHVAKLLVERHIHRVVVVRTDSGEPRPVAVISDSDLVYHMIKED